MRIVDSGVARYAEHTMQIPCHQAFHDSHLLYTCNIGAFGDVMLNIQIHSDALKSVELLVLGVPVRTIYFAEPQHGVTEIRAPVCFLNTTDPFNSVTLNLGYAQGSCEQPPPLYGVFATYVMIQPDHRATLASTRPDCSRQENMLDVILTNGLHVALDYIGHADPVCDVMGVAR